MASFRSRPVSSAPLLLAAVILGLLLFFGEDATLLLSLDNANAVGEQAANISQGGGGAPPPSAAPLDDLEEESIRWNAVINAAEESDFACTNSSLPTSIKATLSAADVSATLFEEGSVGPFVGVDLAFRAYDNDSKPQAYGGDVFVVDYQSHWLFDNSTTPPAYRVFKASAFTADLLNGRHRTRLFFPRKSLEAPAFVVAVSLRHYYTCHDGLKLPSQLQGGRWHRLEFGPSPWREAADAVRSALLSRGINATETIATENNDLPECSEDPRGEYILRGGWTENRFDPPSGIEKMSLDAEWTPFFCRIDASSMVPPEHQSSGIHFRIGDSTMPGRQVNLELFSPLEYSPGRRGIKIKIGIPYIPYSNTKKGEDGDFMDILRNFRAGYNKSSGDFPTNDTFVYGGGLHHIFHGKFNVPAAVALVIRTFCQAGLVFSGHMFLRSLNSIQQHLHDVVDQTALNARRFNWELRLKLHSSGRRLADLCQSIPADDLATFVALPNREGNILPADDANPLLLQLHNYSWDRDSSVDHKNLADWVRGLSSVERGRMYGSRMVGWIDFEGFLLPRPDHYRAHDKIHDSELFFGPEWDMLSIIEGYASKGSINSFDD